jgi:hypothetical protein
MLIVLHCYPWKGLGIARRIDEAFEILESIEKDSSMIGSPRLSPHLICGFLNALIEAGWYKIDLLTSTILQWCP